MVSANSKMADTRSTLLECSVKIRQGRKWKTRWCVMSRQSPVSAEVILKFYKDQNGLFNNKELGREQVCVSATNYCGLEYCYRYPKNIHVLTIVLSDAVILLSFETHERLLEWYHKIKNMLPSAIEFKSRVSIPSKGKLPSGRASFYFYNNHFAITPETPTRLICAWNLSTVIRYGSFDGGFGFSVKVIQSSAKSSNYLLLLDNPDDIKNHFDAATLKHLPSRWSTHSESNPANRDEEQSTPVAERQRLLSENAKDIKNNPEDGENPERTMERILERTLDNQENEPQEGDALVSGADLNRNVQIHSDSRVSSVRMTLGDVIELAEMGRRESQGWTSGDRTDGNRTDGSSRSVLLREETVFGQDMLCPQKNTPIREQEYEVMASFDHYRSSIHEEIDNISRNSNQNLECKYETNSNYHVGRGGGGGMSSSHSRIQHLVNMDRFKLNLSATVTPDEREYVNLPSPQTTLSKTLPPKRPSRTKPVLHTLPKPNILENFNFSPPSSPPPPPPIHKRSIQSFTSTKEMSIHTGLYPTLDMPSDLFGSFSQDSDILVPCPFDHAVLVKPVGPIARLKRNSQDSETSSYIASGSDYDSSHYSSAASSRHNSFDRDPYVTKPPPVPPKSIEALLSTRNFSSGPLDLEQLRIPAVGVPGVSPQDNLPPIPPKPEHLRGKPLHKDPPSPMSPGSRPSFLPPRKRCNTVPTFSAEEGDTEWVEMPDEKDDGYLIMKPAYDNKLKAMHTRSKSVPDEETVHSQTLPLMPRSWQTPSPRPPHSGGTTPTFSSEPCSPVMEYIPQSPIHNGDTMRIQTLKRSATIGGFGNRASRSPSFAGRRPSLLRHSRQRRSLSSDPGRNSHRTSDISLNSAPPRRRRRDKYGSLDHRSLSLVSTKLEGFKDDVQEVPPPSSPSDAAAFHPDNFQQLKDELDKFAGPLSLSPPSSVNSPSRSPPLTPASSVENVLESVYEPDRMHSLP